MIPLDQRVAVARDYAERRQVLNRRVMVDELARMAREHPHHLDRKFLTGDHAVIAAILLGDVVPVGGEGTDG